MKQWKFPPAIVTAVAKQNTEAKAPSVARPNGAADPKAAAASGEGMIDVLAAAVALVPCVFERERLAEQVTTVPAFARLGLDTAACDRLFAASGDQIRALSAALSG